MSKAASPTESQPKEIAPQQTTRTQVAIPRTVIVEGQFDGEQKGPRVQRVNVPPRVEARMSAAQHKLRAFEKHGVTLRFHGANATTAETAAGTEAAKDAKDVKDGKNKEPKARK